MITPSPTAHATGSRAPTTPRSIAYLGNSLTVQKAGYRPPLHEALRRRWGDDLVQVNAGLGGVGSLACAALIDFLVLRHQPDVCIVECSGADMAGATPLDQVAGSMESIVRRLVAAGITPVIVHFDWAPTQVHRSSVLEMCDRIARHYGVTTITVSHHWTAHPGATNSDGFHLTRQGGVEVAHAVAEALDVFAVPGPRLPPALEKDRTAWVATAGSAGVNADDEARPGRFRLSIPVLDVPVGGSVTVRPSRGSRITGLLVVAEDESGVIRLTGDGRDELVQVHDHWCNQPRIQLVWVDPAASSEMTVAMTDAASAERDCRDQPPESNKAGTRLRFVGACMTGEPPSGPAWWQMGAR